MIGTVTEGFQVIAGPEDTQTTEEDFSFYPMLTTYLNLDPDTTKSGSYEGIVNKSLLSRYSRTDGCSINIGGDCRGIIYIMAECTGAFSCRKFQLTD